MDRCGFQTVLKIPFQQWSVQNDFFGLKGRQQAFVGRAWFCTCKTTTVFLQTSPTSLWAPRCLPWQSQTICPAAEICKTFRRFLAFAANAQLPPCHRACRPTLCLGTARWRRSQELFDTASSLGICMNGFSFCQLHYFVRRSGSAPQQPPLSVFQPPCLGRTTTGPLFGSACPAGDISSSHPATTTHL